MKEFNLPIDTKTRITLPFELRFGLGFFPRLLYSKKLKTANINAYENKLVFQGPRTWKRGDIQLEVHRSDYRGASVNYRSINLFGLIFGIIAFLFGVFGYTTYFAGFFGTESDDIEPIIFGSLFLIFGLIIIILSLLRKTLFSVRFVDPNSNSVRYVILMVRRKPVEFYQNAQKFLDQLYPKS